MGHTVNAHKITSEGNSIPHAPTWGFLRLLGTVCVSSRADD